MSATRSPHYDGGGALRGCYDAAGYDPATPAADPLITEANRPLDHAGFVLAFLAGLLDQAQAEPAGAVVVRRFVAEHLGSWVDLLAELLAASGSPYITLLGRGLHELVAEVRDGFALAEEPAERVA